MWSINKHFKAEATLLLAVFIVPVLIAMIALLYVSVRDGWAMDACLDAGGQYVAGDRTCRFSDGKQ